MPAFPVVIFSGAAPYETLHLMECVAREIPDCRISLVCQVPAAETSKARGPAVWQRLGHAVLRLAQASTVKYRDPAAISADELREICKQRGWPMLAVSDLNGEASVQFARQQDAALGVVLGPLAPSPALCEIPRLGCIRAAAEQWPKTEVLVNVYRAAGNGHAAAVLRSASIPIEPLDSPRSASLKSALLAEDLLLSTVRELASGVAMQGSPVLQDPSQPGVPAVKYAHSVPVRYERPKWKLLLRSVLYLFYLPVRNWLRRWRGNFPIVVLYHHLVCDRPHPMGSTTEQFLDHIRYLKQHYRLVSLSAAVAMLRAGKVDQPTAVLTLDDGYADNFVNLRAVLRAEPAPVCLFVCSHMIERGEVFPHDRRDSRMGFPPLTPQQLRVFAAENVEIGSHTQTHFDCGQDDVPRLASEIAESRHELERLIGKKVEFFSFPWGKHANMCDTARQMAKDNYSYYFSAYGGVNLPGTVNKHLERLAHPYSLWELELTLQNILEFQPAGKPAAVKPAAPAVRVPSAAEVAAAVAAGASVHPAGDESVVREAVKEKHDE